MLVIQSWRWMGGHSTRSQLSEQKIYSEQSRYTTKARTKELWSPDKKHRWILLARWCDKNITQLTYLFNKTKKQTVVMYTCKGDTKCNIYVQYVRTWLVVRLVSTDPTFFGYGVYKRFVTPQFWSQIVNPALAMDILFSLSSAAYGWHAF